MIKKKKKTYSLRNLLCHKGSHDCTKYNYLFMLGLVRLCPDFCLNRKSQVIFIWKSDVLMMITMMRLVIFPMVDNF